MEDLTIRTLNENDYDDILVGWWKDWGWDAPTRDFLPDNGRGGILVLDGDTPVCAGFMYITNSSVSWVDWIISNRNYREKPKRKEAIQLLVASLTEISKNSGSKYAYALIKSPNLIETYQAFGYNKADTYTSEMIKIL
jgi:hypothetical protein